MHNYLHGYSRHSNVILSFKCSLSIQTVKVCTACSAVLEPSGNVFHSCLFLNTLDGNTNATKAPYVVSSTGKRGNGGARIVSKMALKL